MANAIKKIEKTEVLVNFRSRKGHLINDSIFIEDQESANENGEGETNFLYLEEEMELEDIERELEELDLPVDISGREITYSAFIKLEEGEMIYEAEKTKNKVEENVEPEVEVKEEEEEVNEKEVGVKVVELKTSSGKDSSEEEEANEKTKEESKEDATPVNQEEVDTSEKILPKYFGEEYDETVRNFLEENEVKEEFINWAMDVRKSNRERVREYPQVIIDEVPEVLDYYSTDDKLNDVLFLVLRNQNSAHSGPTGVGKTTAIRVIATVLNYPLFIIEGNEFTDDADFIGEHTIREKGVISVIDGQMTKAAEYGGILLVDEINIIDADVLSLLNPFTDDRRSFLSTPRGETIHSHEMTRFACTLNEGDEYAGTKQMNTALKNRFVTELYGFPGKTEVKEIIDHFAERSSTKYLDDISFIEKERISQMYGILTSAANDGVLPMDIGSIRTLSKLVDNVPGLGFNKAIEKIINTYDDKEVRGQIAGVLQQNGFAEEVGFDAFKYLNE